MTAMLAQDSREDSELSILDSCIDVSAPPTPKPKEQTKLSEKIKVNICRNF